MIVAMLGITGAHWFTLQTVAWTTMLAKNLQTQSLSEAMSNTFDGEHPCCLCKKIVVGKKAEKKNDYSFSLKKFEFSADRISLIVSAPTHFFLLSQPEDRICGISSEPAVPPPRSLLG